MINELNEMSLEERRMAIAILGAFEWSGLFIAKQVDEIKFVESKGIKLTDLLEEMSTLEKRIAISNAVLYKVREQLSGKSLNKFYIDDEALTEKKRSLYNKENFFRRYTEREEAKRIDEATVVNCAGHAVLAFWYLQELTSWKEEIYCVDFIKGDHVMVVWGQPHKNNKFPQSFPEFDPDAVAIDGWIKVVRNARGFAKEWKVKMEKWKDRGGYIGTWLVGSKESGKISYLDFDLPTDEYWLNLPDKFQKKIFSIHRTEYVSPIYQSAIKNGIPLESIPNFE